MNRQLGHTSQLILINLITICDHDHEYHYNYLIKVPFVYILDFKTSFYSSSSVAFWQCQWFCSHFVIVCSFVGSLRISRNIEWRYDSESDGTIEHHDDADDAGVVDIIKLKLSSTLWYHWDRHHCHYSPHMGSRSPLLPLFLK